MAAMINLTGRRFERLLVLNRYGTGNRNGRARWVCQCDCGRVKTLSSDSLLSGKGRSCGCIHAEQSIINLGKNNRKYFEHEGKQYHQNQFLREFGCGASLDTFRRRVRRGMDPIEAAKLPPAATKRIPKVA